LPAVRTAHPKQVIPPGRRSFVSEQLVGRVAVKSKQLKPGEAAGFEVRSGEIVQISTLEGKQVADFVAVALADPKEISSTAHTRAKNNSIMLSNGMSIYSNLRNQMLEVVEDTVGRHDILFAACDPQRYAVDYGLEGHANCREALTKAMEPFGLTYETIPDPVNWFMNVAILQRGELELRESLAERNDYVLLVATMDVAIGVSACPQDQNDINGGKPTDILVRVFR
jgi:uncharacterized protein YcgI (DUF1989 family)